MKKVILISFFISSMSFAQGYGDSYGNQTYQAPDIGNQSKNDFMIVLVAGGAGAVLGLSTLSFVSEAKDHYDNILTGAALGIIAGVLYVAYRQANTVPSFEEPGHQVQSIEGRTYTFHYRDISDSHTTKVLVPKSPQIFRYTTNF